MEAGKPYFEAFTDLPVLSAEAQIAAGRVSLTLPLS
jgi:hypothetical protein